MTNLKKSPAPKSPPQDSGSQSQGLSQNRLEKNELEIHDVAGDAMTVAAMIAHYGELAAVAEGEYDTAVMELDSWTAKSMLAALRSDEKIAEWKARNTVESLDNYVILSRNVIATKVESAKAKAILAGWQRKADMLKSLLTIHSSVAAQAGSIGRTPNDESRFNTKIGKQKLKAEQE